ncbi:MAG TPA: hypothetical protein VLL73_02255 [Desulfurivibrionaceae bacterium]|nr:hypothetical protein [Desulfurivibrionaceae bacterium]
MKRRSFLKFLSNALLFFAARSTIVATFSRLFVPAPPTASGIALDDIKIDKYGRPTVKGQASDKAPRLAKDNYTPDTWCPPEDPTKCTLKQCGCQPPNPQCNCPAPDKQCNCPPPDRQCNCPSPPNQMCSCPDLICPCPKPPPPPPVPDLICPCPKPPPVPFS